MKLVLIAILTCIFSSSMAFANECNALFEAGTAFHNDGVAGFQKSQTLLQKAVKEYEAGKKKKGCKTLASARKEAAESLKKFQACTTVFEKAAIICAGDNATTAQSNQGVCANSSQSMGQLVAYLGQVNSEYCK